MKITIISGSGRTNSQSRKVADWLADALKSKDVTADVIDLADEKDLPLLHEEVWGDIMGSPAQNIQAKLKDADGYIVITPEWAGMASPALKNFFLYVGKAMADKPALLVGVSAPNGGMYPITELRISSFKNSRIVYLPEHLVVRHVEQVMNAPEPAGDNQDDAYIQERAHYALGVLVEYAKALKPVRSSKAIDYERYTNGM